MRLDKCTEQGRQTLDEFYAEVVAHNPSTGQAMIDLIAQLRELDHPNHVWGLTSHTRLCLLAQDTSASPWYVIVEALNKRNYTVEYLMPSDMAPWPNARVYGRARSADAAVQMIVTAMERSGGWSEVPTGSAAAAG